MNRTACNLCPHKAYLHEDERRNVGVCQVEGCPAHTFADREPARPRRANVLLDQISLWDD